MGGGSQQEDSQQCSAHRNVSPVTQTSRRLCYPLRCPAQFRPCYPSTQADFSGTGCTTQCSRQVRPSPAGAGTGEKPGGWGCFPKGMGGCARDHHLLPCRCRLLPGASFSRDLQACAGLLLLLACLYADVQQQSLPDQAVEGRQTVRLEKRPQPLVEGRGSAEVWQSAPYRRQRRGVLREGHT